MGLTSIVPNPDDLKRTMGTMPPLTRGIGQPPGPEPTSGMASLGGLPPLQSQSSQPAQLGGLKPIVPNPRQEQEQALQAALTRKPQGFWENLRHVAGMAGRVAGDIVAPGTTELITRGLGQEGIGPAANQFRRQQLAGLQTQDIAQQKQASESGLQSAEIGEAQARADALRNAPDKEQKPYTIQTDQGILQWDGNDWTPVEVDGKAANPIAKPGATNKFQHIEGTADGKPTFANYDPSKGAYIDLAGNPLTNFKPIDKSMQGAFGSYGPMRLAGQLLNMAYKENPALLPYLGPIISHMISGAGGGTPGLEGAISQVPAGQPENVNNQAIGLAMPEAPTGLTKSRGQFAESVLPSMRSAQAEIAKLGDSLGPMAGRYNELATSKIGAYGPEFAGLQTTLHNVATAWMRLHANSDAAREDFVNQLRAAQSPENLIAVLNSIEKQATDYVQEGKGRPGNLGGKQNAGQGPAVGTVEGGYRFKGGDPAKQENWEKAK